jgi:hypothetical protein
MKELDGTGKFGQQTITTFGTETDYRHLQTSTDIYRLQLSELSHALADFTHSESMTFTAAGASATVLGRPNDEIAMLLHHDIRDIRDWRCLEMSGVSQKKDENQVSKNL